MSLIGWYIRGFPSIRQISGLGTTRRCDHSNSGLKKTTFKSRFFLTNYHFISIIHIQNLFLTYWNFISNVIYIIHMFCMCMTCQIQSANKSLFGGHCFSLMSLSCGGTSPHDENAFCINSLSKTRLHHSHKIQAFSTIMHVHGLFYLKNMRERSTLYWILWVFNL